MSKFTDAVEYYCEGIDVSVGCLGPRCEHAEYDDNPEEHHCEASFSSNHCDSCGSSFAGDRLPAYGNWYDKTGKFQSIELSICIDCVMWHANGEEPEEPWFQTPAEWREYDLYGRYEED